MSLTIEEKEAIRQKCDYLWGEYKYRHDMIWQRIFQFTTAIVLISVIPYIQPDIARALGSTILIASGLALVLALFVLLVIWNELDAFWKIKQEYRRWQNQLFGYEVHRVKPIPMGQQEQKKQEEKRSLSVWIGNVGEFLADKGFSILVIAYFSSLSILCVVNGYIVSNVWLPALSHPAATFPDCI